MLTAISVKDGAKTSIHLACSDEVKDITGKFFANCEVKKGSSKAKNEEHNQKLWELSEAGDMFAGAFLYAITQKCYYGN